MAVKRIVGSSVAVLFILTYFLIWTYSRTEVKESEREFKLTYRASVKEIPAGARQIRIWIPLARTDGVQKILGRTINCPYPYQLSREPQYGNEILYLFLEPPFPSHIDVAITYHALLKGKKGAVEHSGVDRERDLGSNRWMTINERILGLSREVTKGKGRSSDQARAIYEYVISHMQYDKTTPGWGNGDTLRACLIGKGNCTDFHSLFISLARANQIPSRFKIGFPIPEESEGDIAGYHCWAEFYVEGKGWIPVDASEAWKHPEKKDYWFGTHDVNRLFISTGRDIQLVPRQEGEPINIFFYPYVEVDGKSFPSVETNFRFKEVQRKKEEV